jgi:hypothetical protein
MFLRKHREEKGEKCYYLPKLSRFSHLLLGVESR